MTMRIIETGPAIFTVGFTVGGAGFVNYWGVTKLFDAAQIAEVAEVCGLSHLEVGKLVAILASSDAKTACKALGVPYENRSI